MHHPSEDGRPLITNVGRFQGRDGAGRRLNILSMDMALEADVEEADEIEEPGNDPDDERYLSRVLLLLVLVQHPDDSPDDPDYGDEEGKQPGHVLDRTKWLLLIDGIRLVIGLLGWSAPGGVAPAMRAERVF
jgi:hypothetical protein